MKSERTRSRERAALLFALALDVLGVVLYVNRGTGTAPAAFNPRPIIETAQAATDRTFVTPSP